MDRLKYQIDAYSEKYNIDTLQFANCIENIIIDHLAENPIDQFLIDLITYILTNYNTCYLNPDICFVIAVKNIRRNSVIDHVMKFGINPHNLTHCCEYLIQLDRLDILKKFHTHGVDLSDEKLLSEAIFRNIEICRFLIQECNTKITLNVISQIVAGNCIDIIKILIDRGINNYNYQKFIIKCAIIFRKTTILKLILETGVQISADHINLQNEEKEIFNILRDYNLSDYDAMKLLFCDRLFVNESQ